MYQQEVHSLQDCSMQVTISYITEVVKYLTSRHFIQDESAICESLKALQTFLHASIPIPIWEEMLPKLIDGFLLLYVDISEVREILLLTLHPLTKILHSYWQLEAIRMLNANEKHETLSRIEILKFNTLNHSLLQEALPCLENLQNFEQKYHCTDAVIIALSTYCVKLKYLNVYGSKSVTNESLPAILCLKSLKSLNIANTAFCASGLDILFSHAIQQRQGNNADEALDLQYLEFSNGIRRNYEKLVTAFPRLRHLGIYYIRSSLEMLVSFEGLTSFIFYDGNFRHLKPCLPTLGRHLLHLHLECVQDLDFSFIATYFPVLRSLILRSIINITNLPKQILPSIKTLVIDSAQIVPELIQKLIAQCSNIEKLTLK